MSLVSSYITGPCGGPCFGGIFQPFGSVVVGLTLDHVGGTSRCLTVVLLLRIVSRIAAYIHVVVLTRGWSWFVLVVVVSTKTGPFVHNIPLIEFLCAGLTRTTSLRVIIRISKALGLSARLLLNGIL